MPSLRAVQVNQQPLQPYDGQDVWANHGGVRGFKLTPKVWRIQREDFQAFVTAAKRQADESMEHSEHLERAERSMPAVASPKTPGLERLRVMQSEGFSLQAMANLLNNEGVPTLSGKGYRQKGTIGNQPAQGGE